MAIYSKESNLSYTLGIFPTYELLLHKPNQARRILLSDKFRSTPDTDHLFELAKIHGIEVQTAPKRVSSIGGKDNVYIVGEFEKFHGNLSADVDCHVVLVDPADMGNLGNIIRSCVGFGVTDIALVGNFADHFSPKTVRASMGAIFHLNIQTFSSFDNYLAAHSTRNIYPFMTNGAVGLKTLGVQCPCSLVFGNESSGLPSSFEKIGTPVKILHSSNIDSLNLPTAVAISLFWLNGN